jgi:hypothetical protein
MPTGTAYHRMEREKDKSQVYLNPLSFYKIWFLVITYKNWFLNKSCVGVFRGQFLKIVNLFLLSSF